MTAPAPTAPSTGKFDINKKVSGLPIWGWAALAGGTVLVITKMRAKPAPAQPTVSQGIGYATAGNIPPTTTSDTVRILTNADWSKAAQKDLVQKGHDPAESAAACNAYVAGKTLTGPQTDLVDIALRDIGPLPQSPTGGGSQLSSLHTPKDGNLLGQLFYGIGNALGAGNPDNQVGMILNPFLNDVIDQGPISGGFQAVNQVVGGNFNAGVQGLSIPLPGGLPPITLGGQASNTGLSLTGQSPTGQSGNVGISPNSQANYIGTYTIKDGDTLDSISQEVYGSTGGAQAIYSANLSKIHDPSTLTPGTVLQIPSPSNNV